MTRPQDNITFMRTSAGVTLQAEPLAPGTRLGPWAIEAAIASGGMGQVYRASRADGAYRQAVAIKLIHDRDPVRVARFEAERQRLAEMDHPGIARIIDGGTHEDGRPWMAMELVEGAPLMPAAAGLARTEKLRLFHELCRAVAHAHGRLVLHRDLKSANVLLDEQGAVRLIDFGIATLAEADAEPSTAYTAATAAPEQMRGAAPSVASDIFALGCILHELLTGTVPARDETGGAILDAAAIADRDLVAILCQAAALSYSISRHFIYRNDYVTGLKILEPWMAEGYGPPELLALGKTILAFAHQHTGERDKAEALFREQLRFYEASFEANSLDHAAAASDLATLTRDPDDLAAAEALMQRVAQKPDHPRT